MPSPPLRRIQGEAEARAHTRASQHPAPSNTRVASVGLPSDACVERHSQIKSHKPRALHGDCEQTVPEPAALRGSAHPLMPHGVEGSNQCCSSCHAAPPVRPCHFAPPRYVSASGSQPNSFVFFVDSSSAATSSCFANKQHQPFPFVPEASATEWADLAERGRPIMFPFFKTHSTTNEESDDSTPIVDGKISVANGEVGDRCEGANRQSQKFMFSPQTSATDWSNLAELVRPRLFPFFITRATNEQSDASLNIVDRQMSTPNGEVGETCGEVDVHEYESLEDVLSAMDALQCKLAGGLLDQVEGEGIGGDSTSTIDGDILLQSSCASECTSREVVSEERGGRVAPHVIVPALPLQLLSCRGPAPCLSVLSNVSADGTEFTWDEFCTHSELDDAINENDEHKNSVQADTSLSSGPHSGVGTLLNIGNCTSRGVRRYTIYTPGHSMGGSMLSADYDGAWSLDSDIGGLDDVDEVDNSLSHHTARAPPTSPSPLGKLANRLTGESSYGCLTYAVSQQPNLQALEERLSSLVLPADTLDASASTVVEGQSRCDGKGAYVAARAPQRGGA